MAAQPFARLQGFPPGQIAPTEILCNPSADVVEATNPAPTGEPHLTCGLVVTSPGGSNTCDIQMPAGRWSIVDAKVIGQDTAVAGDLVEFGVVTGVTYTKLGEFDLNALSSTTGLISRLTEILAPSQFETAGPVYNNTTKEWERNPADTYVRCIFTQAGAGTTAAADLFIDFLFQPV